MSYAPAPTPVPVVLGLDPQLKRLGWGVVRVEDGTPVDCGTIGISQRDDGWYEQQIFRAAVQIRSELARSREYQYMVYETWSEKMWSGPNPGRALDLSYVAGVTVACIQSLWPSRVFGATPKTWRALCGVGGKATKDEVFEYARQHGFDLPAKKDDGQDAADAGCIALGGYNDICKRRRHQEGLGEPLGETNF